MMKKKRKKKDRVKFEEGKASQIEKLDLLAATSPSILD